MSKTSGCILSLVGLLVSSCGAEAGTPLPPSANDRSSAYLIEETNSHVTITNGTVSVDVHAADLRDILKQISENTSQFTIAGDGDRLVTDSFAGLPPRQAIERLLVRNYGLVTDELGERIILVFLAADAGDRNSSDKNDMVDSLVARRLTDLDETTDKGASPTLSESPIDLDAKHKKKRFTLPTPLLINSSELVATLTSLDAIPLQFTASIGTHEALYDVGEGETIQTVMEREKPNLRETFERHRQELLRRPLTEEGQRVLTMIDVEISALDQNDIQVRTISYVSTSQGF